MLDFIVEFAGELVFGVFVEVFSGLSRKDDRDGPEILSVVPRLPAGAGVLLAKGGR